ncbi:MAG: chemotaxis protein CheA [Deltaproteobacteria bacterium]|nr:chemotaxis protein CheA [Deltaproteobacteria bacterium]
MSDLNAAANKAVKDFLAEAEEIVDQLGSELADLADMADRSDLNPDLLNSIFRGAHSLKGLAGMFGFNDICELSHNMENLLDWLRLGRLNLDQSLMPVLFQSHELLTLLVRNVAEGGSADQAEEIAACIASINACLAPPEKSGGGSPLSQLGLSEAMLGALTEYEEHRLLENLAKGRRIYSIHTSFKLTTFDQELAQVSDLLKTYGELISTLPRVGGNMETNIDFDILFGTTLKPEEWVPMIERDSVCVTALGAFPSPPQAGLPEPPVSPPLQQPSRIPVVKHERDASAAIPPPLPSPAPAGAEEPQSAKSMSRTVRVDIGKLDELMNIVGELVLAHSSISAIATKMRTEAFSRISIELGKAAKGLGRRLTDLQKGVMEIRMIPVGQLYEKMSRIVRKISREQGKKVELKFNGADTELDKLIVEDISDPMMHIIRNAIDHGIETPELREALGKDEKGTIRISSYQKGNHVVIEVEDDGGGIDIERIKSKALQKGLVQDVGDLSDKEALDLIFMPGFSTNDEVSEVSGRGVGMDVVRNNIAAISGMVDIETVKGAGTRFIITIPITLAIIKVLIISCSGRTYAIPVTSVLESLLLTGKDIRTVERKEVIQLRETTLPLLSLDTFFGIDRRQGRPGEFYVVVVGVAEKRLGIVVDDLLGQQDIVIKSMGSAFRRFRGISGAADLGDQRTILVLDVGGMINEAMKSGN